MAIEKKKFIDVFVRQALENRISLFLGSGASADAGYPTWKYLFEPMARELGIKIEKNTDYYKLAQYYANQFGKAELKSRIQNAINSNNFKSELLNELLDIDFSNIWTTNFDNVIEDNYKARNILINKVFTDADLSNIDLNRLVNVFKMNGDISNPEGLITTQGEFEKYHEKRRLMLMFLKRELISNTFLFVGYSFTDHLVLDCLSELANYLNDTSTHHYAIMKDDKGNAQFKCFINDLEIRYHVHVLLVKEYSEIPKVLSQINDKIKSKKVFISGAFNSVDVNLYKYSHELAQKLTNSLFQKDYRIVNGIGRSFGTHIIGYANEYLAKHGVKNIQNHLIIKPFVGNKETSDKEKNHSRAEVIGKCGVAIFVFGDKMNSESINVSGVMQEFEIARKLHKVIIPIAYPNMISNDIWELIKDNITEFPYLEGKLDYLTSKCQIDKVIKTIVQILDSVQKSL
ncbi:SIR2 family protein [Anaerorhabdus furcosa]|uniref:SIR2-like domain-containing protein n=1 Tax=Anaerorhabdus furcosa TaxID=118967 RepID=A0A1T4M349_9FIRM|nr:SIR2 family protein [Anaerorhabdus furcosa]SJZ61419.1 SIR2-like domain-containing protein [Anaerorhabdus furcosa]